MPRCGRPSSGSSPGRCAARRTRRSCSRASSPARGRSTPPRRSARPASSGEPPSGSPVGHLSRHARLTPRQRRELARSFLVTDEPMNGPGQEGSTVPPALAELAAAHGVQCEYTDHDGNLQQVSASTLVAVLEALGVPASTPAAVTASLERSRDDEWRAVLPPTVVVREGAEAQVPVHVADGADVSVWVELELSETPAMPAGATPWRVTGPQQAGTATGSFATVRGTRVPLRQADIFVEPRTVDSRKVGRATFVVPDDLPLGWHTLHAESGGQTAQTPLVITPQRLELPDALARTQAWGILVQLYSVRSRDSWGMGDLADLADLAWQTAHNGNADFVGVNPLHATEPVTPVTPSPYLPTSRRFMSPLYIRVEDIRETAYLS